jgi:hypothetical protein
MLLSGGKNRGELHAGIAMFHFGCAAHELGLTENGKYLTMWYTLKVLIIL